MLRGQLLLTILFVVSCNKSSQLQSSGETSLATAPQVERGKTLYFSNCMVCHNQNPSLAGSVGPELKGASLELLTAKVLHQRYPEGYKTKRTTAIMPAFALSDEDLAALHEFLK